MKNIEFDTDKEREQEYTRLKEYFKEADIQNKKSIQERLWKMINYAIGRFDYYEEYRRRYLQIGLALIGLAVTLFALVGREYLSSITNGPEILYHWNIGVPYLAIAALVFALMWVGVRQLYYYNKYSSPEYPYREIIKTDWHFRYVKGKPTPKLLLKTKFDKSNKKEERDKVLLQQSYLEELRSYGESISKRDENDTFANDVEQLMALHTLTQYKSAQSTLMRDKLKADLYLLSGVMIAAIIAIIISFTFTPVTVGQANSGDNTDIVSGNNTGF